MLLSNDTRASHVSSLLKTRKVYFAQDVATSCSAFRPVEAQTANCQPGVQSQRSALCMRGCHTPTEASGSLF